jgi:hypothetical protein
MSCGVISHREDLLGKVVITSNNEIISELSWQFDNIKKQSNKFDAGKKSLHIK